MQWEFELEDTNRQSTCFGAGGSSENTFGIVVGGNGCSCKKVKRRDWGRFCRVHNLLEKDIMPAQSCGAQTDDD